MSEKLFNSLSKYYGFSKKYIPIITLGVFVILLFCKLSTPICMGIYFGLLVIHLLFLFVSKKLIEKYIENIVLTNDETEVINDESIESKKSN